ncbi:alpha/beta family hydrolase [Oryzobacter terrae]|uniref:alpha/beta hydrolase family protein n=1 Tax=Oryzobacter terrae TaxID=1620385 RepID=UPI00366DA082
MTERLVPTPEGPARTTTTDPAAPVVGTLVLGHGAGGLRWTLDVLAVRDVMVAAGWQVVLVDQPWRVAERRIGPRPPALDAAWVPVLADVERHRRGGRLVTGGRSAGARVACRTAAAVGADAVVCLSFPLHLPGKPQQSRAAELALPAAHGLPVHVVQGSTDPFGTPAEVEAVLPPLTTLDVVPGPHSLGRVADRVAALVLARLSPGE